MAAQIAENAMGGGRVRARPALKGRALGSAAHLRGPTRAMRGRAQQPRRRVMTSNDQPADERSARTSATDGEQRRTIDAAQRTTDSGRRPTELPRRTTLNG